MRWPALLRSMECDFVASVVLIVVVFRHVFCLSCCKRFFSSARMNEMDLDLPVLPQFVDLVDSDIEDSSFPRPSQHDQTLQFVDFNPENE